MKEPPNSGWYLIANVAHFLEVNGVVSSCASVNLENGDDPFAIRFDRHQHLGVVELCDLCRERMQAQRTERESAVVEVCSCEACAKSSVAREHRRASFDREDCTCLRMLNASSQDTGKRAIQRDCPVHGSAAKEGAR